jgi:hypothetical protein
MVAELAEKVESLLYESEGTSLDFKSQQYKFQGGTLEEKAELLKDVVAFSNSWRRATAYILIGVKERPGKAVIQGTTDHLRDADIQQFVNSKTNRAVEFSCHSCAVEGKMVDVIRIPVQPRPTYLLKRYGPLESPAVYVRRGSSTTIASPEEIARMGSTAATERAEPPVLDIDFLNPETLEPFGKDISLEITAMGFPDRDAIPDYSVSSGPISVRLAGNNPDFYRELIDHLRDRFGLREVTLLVRNTGSTTAYDVRLRARVEDPSAQLIIKDATQLEDFPSRSIFERLTPFASARATYDIRQTQSAWIIDCVIGKVQPQASVEVGGLCVGATASRNVKLPIELYADNLHEPICLQLGVEISVQQAEITMEDLYEFN